MKVTTADRDMLWRVALSEFFTSPTSPSKRSPAANLEIVLSLGLRGLVQWPPGVNRARITDAGRLFLTVAQLAQLEDFRTRRDEIDRQEAARERRKADLADHNATPKPRKVSPVTLYPLGTIVDVLGSNTQRVEYVGKVIKLTTRLHVAALHDGPTTGHMAYEAKFVRERIRAHEHRFGVMEPSAIPHTDVECCNGCERSARELGIAVRS